MFRNSRLTQIPAILHFERVDRKECLDFSQLPAVIDPAILCRETSISMSVCRQLCGICLLNLRFRNRDPTLIKHELLEFSELLTPGTVVAVDAEFVSMQQVRAVMLGIVFFDRVQQQEETEYRSDGTKKVIRPARLSLARVSCLRGNGPKEGTPFVDDHIHTSEVIVDYLTEFSGIKCELYDILRGRNECSTVFLLLVGDLDPLRSPHTLTPLKVVYKKLRLLLDRGCIFIGHGLSKDFRIISAYIVIVLFVRANKP